MYQILQTDEFIDWLGGLKDGKSRMRLIRRLQKVEQGNFGDIKPVGDGVWEMREFFGGGFRMYYIQKGSTIIVMLGGGDKSTQKQDIIKAIELSKTVELDDEATDKI